MSLGGGGYFLGEVSDRMTTQAKKVGFQLNFISEFNRNSIEFQLKISHVNEAVESHMKFVEKCKQIH